MAVAFILVGITRDTPSFLPILAWAVALVSAQIFTLYRLGTHRHRAGRHPGNPGRRALLNSLGMGVIWGALPAIGLPSHDHFMELTIAVVVCGMLFAAGFSLLILPGATLAFCAPVVVGSFIAILRMENSGEAMMLTIYSMVMVAISARYSRNTVGHLVQESTIREQNGIISLLLKEFEQNSSDWLWEFDRTGRLQRVSQRFADAAGTSLASLVGRDFVTFLHDVGTGSTPIVDEIGASIEARETISGIEMQVTIAGVEHHWRLTGKPTFDERGGYTGYIGTGSDITAAKVAERRINFLAHNDALTGLLNRAKFTDHLKQCVARLERYGSPFVVLYLDLDQFKAANDSRGHLVGDRILVEVSARIRSALRESDIAARLGGDEFAIILTNGSDTHEIGALAQRLVELIGKPYEFDDEVVAIGASIGIAIAPINGTRPDQILRNADLALYRAKAEGRGT